MSKKNVKFPEMKKALHEREHVSRLQYRKAIQEAAGMDRWRAWVDKRDYGDNTRHLLLAYGMARGLTYAQCERKCHERNYPSPTAIVNFAGDHGVELDVEQVRAWIAARDAEPVKEVSPPPSTEPAVVSMSEPEKPKGFFARIFGRTA